MNNTLLYGYLPYAVLALVVGAPLVRYRERLFGRGARWLQRLGGDSVAVALLAGGAITALGHAVGFLFPRQVQLFTGSPLRLLVLEVTGLIGGLLLAFGLLQHLFRWLPSVRAAGPAGWARIAVYALLLAEVVNGLYLALALRWGSVWYVHVVVPYLRSLLAFQPDTTLIVQLPLAARLHVLGGFALLLAMPAARWLEAANPNPIRIAEREETARQAGATP